MGAGNKTTKEGNNEMKNFIKCLAWTVVGTANIALGYLLWTYAAFETGGAVIGLLGAALIIDAVTTYSKNRKVIYRYGA